MHRLKNLKIGLKEWNMEVFENISLRKTKIIEEL